MVGQQNADIGDIILRDVAMATIFVFLCMGMGNFEGERGVPL